MERDFKGIWIPKEIWLDERLNALDKIILSEINSLDGDDGCYASNQYLAEFCQCSEAKVSKSIALLIDLGYIQVLSFDGRKRFLKTCLVKNTSHVKNTSQPSKKYKADSENLQHNNIDNNIANNNDTKVSLAKAPEYGNHEINEMFELWKNMFGYMPKNSAGNRRAVYNMLRSKDKGREWIINTMKILKEAQKDRFAGKDVNGVSNFEDLQYRYDKIWKWGSNTYQKSNQNNVNIEI